MKINPYAMVMSMSPALTEAPFDVATPVTVPPSGAMISFSIFMASSRQRTVPFSTF